MAKKKVKKENKRKKGENPAKHEKKDKKESQIKWVIGIMIIVFLAAIAAYFIAQESKKFEYGGLKFEKIMYDKLILYNSKIPIKNAQGTVIANYNLYLRNDPRELRDIKINGNIRLMNDAVVSLDPEAERGCSDSGIAGGNFFSFLKTAGVRATLAYSNESYADERNAAYTTCNESNGKHTTIMINKGDSNEISQSENECYTIEFRECDVLKVVERFIVATIANSKGIIV